MRKDLLLPKDLLYMLILINMVFNFLTFFFNLNSAENTKVFGGILTYTGLFSGLVVSMVLIIDVFVNRVNARYLWTLAILFSGGIFGFFYLRSRDNYLNASN